MTGSTEAARRGMFGVDVGGTFTDVVAVIDGEIRLAKVPSYPPKPERSVIEGAARLDVAKASLFNHASTKGLNAVLTRALPKVGFVTTEGHRDMLDAGRGWRPLSGQTTARWRRPFGDAARPLVERYLRRGVRERVSAEGEILIPLDEADARRHFELLKRCNVEGVAICLLNAYRNGAHEARLREIASQILGDIPISISSETSPLAKEYARASTTLIDVFMKLMYGGYTARLREGLAALGFEGDLNFADCAAALQPAEAALEHPYRIVFAGPAAGAQSCLHFGRAIGEENMICVDVGGTSTDIALIVEGAPFVRDRFDLEFDLVINAISTEISSVGAGGGSIVSISSSGDVQVGPGSAGAIPGPACYDRGGDKPAVTDACLLMGIIAPEGFAGGALKLREDLARAAFESLDSPLSFADRVAFAYRIAVHNIAEEVANVAIRHGADPRSLSLIAYGAAGPMLLSGVLDLIGAKRLIVPPHPGLFSALGLISTDHIFSESACRYRVLDASAAPEIATLYAEMEDNLLRKAKVARKDAILERSFDGRLMGQTWETPLIRIGGDLEGEAAVAAMIEAFHAEYERRNGKRFEHLPVQAVQYRVRLIVPERKLSFPEIQGDGRPLTPQPIGAREIRHLGERPLEAALYRRGELPFGARFMGPAIVSEDYSTTFIAPGQQAAIGRFGEIVLTRLEGDVR